MASASHTLAPLNVAPESYIDITGCSPQVLNIVSFVVNRDKKALSEIFYTSMMKNVEAALFLNSSIVEAHLKPGLERWLEMLFCQSDLENLKAVFALQRHIGEIHARAEIPVNLVACGMRLIKRDIMDKLVETDLSRSELGLALMHVGHLIDYAFELMICAYSDSHEHSVKTHEAFRQQSAGINLTVEREKQHSAILEWENMLFRTMAQELNLDRLFPLETSQFGLWLRHKAPLVFGDILEISLIDSSIMRIDSSLLPQITHAALNNPRLDSVRTIVKGILVETEQIKYHLKLMFDRMTEMEVGRDALTQLFNRRFLPTILKKEIEISRKKGGNFSVLMLDIDHFKLVNDTYGHDAGDRVLQQISALIMNNLHAGDFAFRYGGEEFLIVLTEIDATKSVDIAEKIRQRIESSDILLSNGRTMHCTMSIGVAINDGHPDYQRLIERADNALYQAKNSGRNKVVLSSSILK